jgi:hypothetical protein
MRVEMKLITVLVGGMLAYVTVHEAIENPHVEQRNVEEPAALSNPISNFTPSTNQAMLRSGMPHYKL